MPNTPNLALPYPVAADTVDVPRDILALATRLDTSPTGLVAALPGAPVDGQTIAYQNAAMAAAGVVWSFAYRAASPSAYKWEFIGGTALYAAVPAQESFSNQNWSHLGTYGPTVTLPLAGDYECRFGATNVQVSGPGGGANMGVVFDSPGGEPALFHEVAGYGSIQAAVSLPVTGTFRKTVSGVAVCVYQVTPGTGLGYWAGRYLSMTPIRVG